MGVHFNPMDAKMSKSETTEFLLADFENRYFLSKTGNMGDPRNISLEDLDLNGVENFCAVVFGVKNTIFKEPVQTTWSKTGRLLEIAFLSPWYDDDDNLIEERIWRSPEAEK